MEGFALLNGVALCPELGVPQLQLVQLRRNVLRREVLARWSTKRHLVRAGLSGVQVCLRVELSFAFQEIELCLLVSFAALLNHVLVARREWDDVRRWRGDSLLHMPVHSHGLAQLLVPELVPASYLPDVSCNYVFVNTKQYDLETSKQVSK